MNDAQQRPKAEPLSPNQPPHFYRGGAAIAAFRGLPVLDDHRPEDWVASATARFGTAGTGLSVLAEGTRLADAVRGDPYGWLGGEHVARFGHSTALLVKLLDAGQRLPVHCHPSDDFARTHLSAACGKTEAWLVLGTTGERPRVWAGFRDDVDEAMAYRWVSEQDGAALLGALNEIPVRTGDALVIPAGLPHAIGEGVFVLELQQPSDLSLTLEWLDFLDTAEQAHLGIGFERALAALDRSAWDNDRLATLLTRRESGSLLADAADDFFRADRLSGGATVEPGFAVIVVLGGSGTLHTDNGAPLPLARGTTVVVPHAAGPARLSGLDGALDVIACRPPTVPNPGETVS
ncbi:class I mannose-6-phosphate isomerase [Haloechinothrix salitolerans]|uniref:Class I mannose-6-phosphate isomerase n=1 Tax=Haloechinothrix salitolerans TaxID=926830 RepID=A0ABW2C3Z9_9PSEU